MTNASLILSAYFLLLSWLFSRESRRTASDD